MWTHIKSSIYTDLLFVDLIITIQKNRVVNLRALSKNSKKKIDKKSGRKQPRVNDYEIEFEPAPDSAITLNTPLKQNVMKTPSTVGSVKPTPQKMNDVSTPKSKRKIRFKCNCWRRKWYRTSRYFKCKRNNRWY